MAPATGIIADNDLPVVSVAADPAAVEEGGTATFTLTRVGDLTAPLTVPVTVTERGAFLAEGAPTEATFATDAETTTLQVATDDDERDEADGAVTATVAERATHRVGEAASATVPVTDNDERDATVTPTSLTVDEGASASYAVVLTSEPTADVTVAVQVPENAEVAVDETELTFTAEDWNQAQTVTVTAAADADAVADDPLMLTHAISGGDYDTVTAESVAVTITEDDTPEVSVADAVAAEGDEVLEFTVRLNVASSQTVTVEYVTADSTATAGTDYEATTGMLAFPALVTTQTIRVPIIDDDLRRGGRSGRGRAGQCFQRDHRRWRGNRHNHRQRLAGGQCGGRPSGRRRRWDGDIHADASGRLDRDADGANKCDRARRVPRGWNTHRGDVRNGCGNDDASGGDRRRRARRGGRRGDGNGCGARDPSGGRSR